MKHPIYFILSAAFIFISATSPAPENAPISPLMMADCEGNPQCKVAQAVFDKLVLARGDQSKQAPKLIWSKWKTNVASASPSAGIIRLDAEAYQICTEFGKDSLNALAFLLGHEMIHYYNNHTWESNFAIRFPDTMNIKLASAVKENIKDLKKDEIESDYLGGFLAYTAGFAAFNDAEQFLRKVYDRYNFSENLPGYPSLNERIKMTEDSNYKLHDLVNLFEMGNYLFMMGFYDDAKLYYNYVLKEFPSRENFNNMGTTLAMESLGLFPASYLKYYYPLELDLHSRGNTKDLSDKKTKREQLLQKAISEYFLPATQLDPNYLPALVNMASAKALLAISHKDSDPELSKLYFDDAQIDARWVIHKAKAQNQPTNEANGHLLLALIAAENKNAEKSVVMEHFNRSIALNSLLARENRDLYEGKKQKPDEVAGNEEEADPFAMFSEGNEPEKIEGKELAPYLRQLANEQYSDNYYSLDNIVNEFGETILFEVKELENSRVLRHSNPKTRWLAVHMTNPGYTCQDCVSAKKIGLGASVDAIRASDAYKAEDRIIPLSDGNMLQYKEGVSNGVMFQLDSDNLVKAWAIYNWDNNTRTLGN